MPGNLHLQGTLQVLWQRARNQFNNFLLNPGNHCGLTCIFWILDITARLPGAEQLQHLARSLQAVSADLSCRLFYPDNKI